MVVARLLRLLVSRFLKAFVKNLDDVGIEWASIGPFILKRLNIRPLALTSWLDLESLYIHRLSLECSWKFLWNSSEILTIEIDTIVGLIVPCSTSSVRYMAWKDLLYEQKDLSYNPLLSHLVDRLLDLPLQHRPNVVNEQPERGQGFFSRVTQWGIGSALTVASRAVFSIGTYSGFFGREKGESGWTEALLQRLFRLIGRIRVVVKNCHIRYEDKQSCPNHPFQTGVTVEEFRMEGTNVLVQTCSSQLGYQMIETENQRSTTNPGLQINFQILNFSVYHNHDCYTGISATDFTAGSREYRKHFLRAMGRSSDSHPKHRLAILI